MPTSLSRFLTAVLIIAAAIYWVVRVWKPLHQWLEFDDAFMFYRYAVHLRQGLGVAWNLDGIATYGETSPLWGLVVLLLSFLPTGMSKVLILGSWVCSLGAILALAWATARNAQAAYMTSTWRVLPLVAVPLMATQTFSSNSTTGMETMLATLLAAVFVGLVLAWSRGLARPEFAGAIGILLFLTRPEAALVVVVMPILVFLLLMPRESRKGLATLLTVFFAGFLLDLLLCKLYFHTALPLSFYMKSGHAYEGYHKSWFPLNSTLGFLASCNVFILLVAFLGRKTDWRLLIACTLPALLTFAYLGTVTQIMGYNSRYYVPYFAFFVVPALLVFDRWLITPPAVRREPWSTSRILACGAAVVSVLIFFLVSINHSKSLTRAADIRLEGRHFAYDPVRFEVAADRPLPSVEWSQAVKELSELLVHRLPAGASVAASEVGYIGGLAPDVNIIDLEGLNDPEIALHGFNMDALLARKPDLIWMPHNDYTYQRGLMLANPQLLRDYDLYVGAANYGLALRKQSPVRAALNEGMQALWTNLYPDYRMSDYLVKSTHWTGRKYRVTDETQAEQQEKDQIEHATQE